jgi:hypothetical protein
MTSKFIPVSKLEGRVVTSWQCVEMALAEARDSVPVRWRDSSIPFLQFTSLDLQLADGQALRLLSELEHDRDRFHGFYLVELEEFPSLQAFEERDSIFRDRVIPELPLGRIEIAHVRPHGPNAVAEMHLRILDSEVRFLAAEVYEERDGSLRIVEHDESILIQVNGACPSQPA